MATVSLVRCDEYKPDLLKEKIVAAANLAGMDFSSLSGLRVALKPNLLSHLKAGNGVTTSLEFFRAAAELVLDCGGECVVVESPAVQALSAVMRKTGYLDTARSLGIGIADESVTAVVRWDGARRYKTAEVIRHITEVDAVLNLPKCKTHSLTYFTGAVKNLFGLIPGMRKSRMHMKAPTSREFSEFLLDFYGTLLHGLPNRPRFIHLMDAVTVLEGEGPGPAGEPRHMGAILAGEDALALDLAAVRAAGLDEKKVLTLELGYGRGLGISSPDELSLTGDYTPPTGFTSLKPAKSSLLERSGQWPRAFRAIKKLLVEKPVPRQGPCTLCYECRKICPAGAISAMRGKRKVPVFDYDLCIRCFCCMEVCPGAAIDKKPGRFQWIMER